MAYSRYHDPWEDFPSTDTPVSAEALDHIEDGLFDTAAVADTASADASAAAAAAAAAGVVAADAQTDANAAQADATLALGNLTSHEADTTAVHGIANTALLETTAGAQAKADAKVSDTAYGVGWNADTDHAPSKNAVYDKIESLSSGVVDDTAYDATTWNNVTSIAPSKNAVRDKVENLVSKSTFPVEICVALSDEVTALVAGTAVLTMRAPFAFTLTAVRSSLTVVSSSGLVTVDINEAGASLLSTKLSIDANEKTSTTAAAAAVISDSAIADDAELTFDIDAAGTGAIGLKVWLIGTRVLA